MKALVRYFVFVMFIVSLIKATTIHVPTDSSTIQGGIDGVNNWLTLTDWLCFPLLIDADLYMVFDNGSLPCVDLINETIAWSGVVFGSTIWTSGICL